jgi:Xaa-Pro aminopeptidase
MNIPRTPASAFQARRAALHARLTTPALLASGSQRPRNYLANPYPFRATSHFLYFLGDQIPDAALLFAEGRTTLFTVASTPADALWSGPTPSFDELREKHGLDAVRPVEELEAEVRRLGQAGVATLPTQDAGSAAWLSKLLGREVRPNSGHELDAASIDGRLAEAIIALRRVHDEAAIAQLRAVARATAAAHVAGMKATRGAGHEYEVAAAMLAELRRHHLVESYGPIVSTHGEVLHNESHANPIRPGDLLLADVGGETPEGWAGDITRVWPATGRFSPTQRAIYDVVLAVQKQAVASVRPGVRYRSIHEQAGRTLIEGLRDLGILRGEVDGLYERNASGIFFPHGVGHLLGLDVHDIEDLGDRAAYAPGRERPERFGDRYLRLDLDLVPGMAVTIEPGFYQVPAILADDSITGAVGADLDRAVLAKFADVRGIRIEDDVLVGEDGPVVLTSDVPKEAEEIEALMAQG